MIVELNEWAKKKILTITNVSETEMKDIRRQIWLDALRACSKPLNSVELEGSFKQKILDWCAKQKQ